MKIAVIMGSPRKKDSYRICKLVEDSFSPDSGAEFEYLFLKDYHIEDCRGCDQCFQKGEAYCPCSDELNVIKEKLLEASGIIFASPVNACQISGLMKRFIDRFSYLFHRQELAGKPALTVVTTAGGGQKPTGRYLKMTACGWGCNLTGEISIVSTMFFNHQKNSRYEKYHAWSLQNIKKQSAEFEKAVLSGRLPVPSCYDIFMFQCLRSKTFIYEADHDYWDARGWIQSDYFYKTKLNPAKRLFARGVRSFVNLAVKNMVD